MQELLDNGVSYLRNTLFVSLVKGRETLTTAKLTICFHVFIECNRSFCLFVFCNLIGQRRKSLIDSNENRMTLAGRNVLASPSQ